jgi:hypothetical protein
MQVSLLQRRGSIGRAWEKISTGNRLKVFYFFYLEGEDYSVG